MATKNNTKKKLNWRKTTIGESSEWRAQGTDVVIYDLDYQGGFFAYCKDDYEGYICSDLDEITVIIDEDYPVADLATAKAICQKWHDSVYLDIKQYLGIKNNQRKLDDILYQEQCRLEEEYERASEKLDERYDSERSKFDKKLDALYEKIGKKAEKFAEQVAKDHPAPEPESKSVVTDAMIDAAIESMNSKQSRESVKKALEAAIAKEK